MLSLDFLDHLERESARFASAVVAAGPSAPVPSCPGWTAADLLWHLAEVQWFWGEIVRSGARSPEEYAQPERPADEAGLVTFYRAASGGLLSALATAEPDTPAWTWSDDQTVGFIRRRQAHEALIHRVDAELTAGERTAMDPLLSTDGVDEALRLMYGGRPSRPFSGNGHAVRVATTDTGRSWLVVVGRGDPVLDVAPADNGRPAAATVRGTAADLDCRMWNRPPLGEVERDGDEEVLAAFEGVLAEGVQ